MFRPYPLHLVCGLAAGLALTGCGGDKNDSNAALSNLVLIQAIQQSQAPKNLAQIAQSNGYKTLVDAAIAADLGDELVANNANLTVFAPSNAAFAAIPNLSDLLLPANKPLLTSILTYHVLPSVVLSPAAISAATSAGETTTLNGAKVTLDVVGGSLYANEAKVGPVDVLASNGVIHGLNRVITPPAPILTTLQARGFTTLASALVSANLASAMDESNDPPLTLFAPTNDALAAAGAAGLDVGLLTKILRTHALSGVINASGAIAAAGSPVTTLEPGAGLTPQVTSAGDLTVSVGNTTATVTLFNIRCTNGVIHVIDKVLLPLQNLADTATLNGYSTLVTAAVAAPSVAADLADPNDLQTVFAPTNDAFAAVPNLADLLLPANQATLQSVLRYHTLTGNVSSVAALALASSVGEATTRNGAPVYLDVVGGSLFVNEAKAGPLDIAASNGTIHGLDRVITPPDTILATLNARGFTTLAGALTTVGLSTAVDDDADAPLTVFAPTNAALAAAGAGSLDALTLTAVLRTHILNGVVKASGAIAAAGTQIPTLQPSANVRTELANGVLRINTGAPSSAAVTLFNIRCTNGVIHVIDAVLLPSLNPASIN
jgi:uncharacterized surface protein with fasciclin (FAS1) repeats